MSSRPKTTSQEIVAGLVERVTYHNADDGFFVLRATARGLGFDRIYNAQVAYWANWTVEARAHSSVLTLISATEPRSTAR
jgi:hypothetical protein